MTRIAPSMRKPLDSRWRNYSRFRIAPRAGDLGSRLTPVGGVTIARCRMPSCSPRWRASTRISGRVIRRSCSRGSRAFRPHAMRCGIAAAAAGRRACRSAEHFAVVHATDVAPEQIAAAKPHPRVRYSVAPAEHSGLADASVDLVTVAQALHWFDVTAFYAEARRVARPGALLAVWTYPRPQFVDAELDRRFFDVLLAGGRAVLAAGAPARRGGLHDAAVSLRGNDARRSSALELRLESRAGRGLREQLVGHRALSPGAGRGSACRCCATRSPPPGRPPAPACRSACPSACGSGACAPRVVRSAP